MAGGDGTRLLPLTRRLTGDNTPKQFVALTGVQTLLEDTLRRVSHVVPRRNTLLLLTRTHEHFYANQVGGLPADSLLIQPYNHGTAPALAYALTRLDTLAPNALVGLFPSDHHFESEEALAVSVSQAFRHAELDRTRIVLLGIEPESAEEGYGWIEPGALLHRVGAAPVFEVLRFWEKPSKKAARRLMDAGSLWNSFIMVGCTGAFLNILRRAVPDLLAAFESMWATVEPGQEEHALSELFSRMPASNFSQDVLSVCPSELAVLPAIGTGWTDLGEPERVQSALRLRAIERSGSGPFL
jgi:mannose-1-phosphate guanylyltransferase